MMTNCVWANVEPETKLLVCKGFCEENEVVDDALTYSLLFSESVKEMMKVAKVIKRRLKVRESILDNG